jgi:hypothetical protein
MDPLHYVQSESFLRSVSTLRRGKKKKIINNFIHTQLFCPSLFVTRKKRKKKRGEDGAEGEKENLMFKNKKNRFYTKLINS